MTEHASLDVARAAVRIDERAIVGLRDRIDREVAPLQILFQRHRRIGIDDEAAIATPALALGPRQRVLLAGIGMQEHGEVATHGLEASRFHPGLGGADHHPVAIAGRQAQQPVAYRAADEIGLHAAMMPDRQHHCLR